MLRSQPTSHKSKLLAVLVVLLGIAGCGGSTEPETTQPAQDTSTSVPTTQAVATTTTATTVAVTTTEPVPTTEAVESLLAVYYEAYNSGDVETVTDLLDGMMSVNTAPNLMFWIGDLQEQVEANCVPALDTPGAMRCSERYTDALHGPAGISGQATYQYFERNGQLLQLKDASFRQPPGCKAGRCPGEIQAVAGAAPTWNYEQFEADLFAWLSETHPDVASVVEESVRLHYMARKSEAVQAAIPFVEEFVAQSEDWGSHLAAGPDFTDMTTLEATVGIYEALWGHDPVAYEEFFGEPPGDVMEWFWAQGRKADVTCVETDDPDKVRCEGSFSDDFYTVAGAVFEFRELWERAGDDLLSTVEWSNSSGYWAYNDFERDLAAWMRDTYPDDAAIAFPTDDLVHNGEAAAIAVGHLAEFLEASDKYPRSPDGKDDWRG